MARVLGVAVAMVLSAATPATAASLPGASDPARVPVVLVANAEGGTVSIVDAVAPRVLDTIDVVPDGRRGRLGTDDPLQATVGQLLIEAAGGTNLAQDQDVSPDGRTLYVSRGHRGDVAAFDIASERLLWKVAVPGLRADHMTISPDGRRLYVSALTANKVVVIDTLARAIVARLTSGQWPHDNHLSADGTRLYNASIGTIVAPETVRRALGKPYRLTVTDTRTLQIRRTYDLPAGIRPIVLARDERTMYAQFSHFHGIGQVDLTTGRVVRAVSLPVDAGVTEDDYDFEAPHHGLAVSHDESLLCAAGRASDYVALVSTAALAPVANIEVGDAPGWAATGPDGRFCFVPNTRADTLSVISYAERREVARLAVGDGPKQIEAAYLPRAVL